MVEKLTVNRCEIRDWGIRRKSGSVMGAAFCWVNEFPKAILIFGYNEQMKRGRLLGVTGDITNDVYDFIMKNYEDKQPIAMLKTQNTELEERIKFMSMEM